jgi:hypothetical protein
MPPAFWRRAWKKVSWMRRLSGATLSDSTASRGAAAWIASLPVSPVRTSQTPANEPGLGVATVADSGSRLSASFAKFNQHGFFWKTCQQSLFAASTEFCGTWPTAGSMRNGVASKQATLGLHIGENGGSVWPTAKANEEKRQSKKAEAKGFKTLGEVALLWHTPATDMRPSKNKRRGIGDQAMLWHTPHGMSGRDATGKEGAGGEFSKQAVLWATAAQRDWKNGMASEKTMNRNAFSLRGQTRQTGTQSSIPAPTSRLQLNPRFVNWLMGLPPTWTLVSRELTSCELAEMESWYSRLRLLFESCTRG